MTRMHALVLVMRREVDHAAGVTFKVAPISNRSGRTVRLVWGEGKSAAVGVVRVLLVLRRFGLEARRFSAPPVYSKSPVSIGCYSITSKMLWCGSSQAGGSSSALPRGAFTRRGHTHCRIVLAFLFHLGHHSSGETLTVIACSFDHQPTCPRIVKAGIRSGACSLGILQER